jgi:hypothetical protein
MKVLNKTTLYTALFLLCGFAAVAQPDFPNPSPTPFGFLEILIGAGALYGGKKVYDQKKEKSN